MVVHLYRGRSTVIQHRCFMTRFILSKFHTRQPSCHVSAAGVKAVFAATTASVEASSVVSRVTDQADCGSPIHMDTDMLIPAGDAMVLDVNGVYRAVATDV